MNQHLIRNTALGSAIIGIGIDIASLILLALLVTGRSGNGDGLVAIVATVVMITTLVLQAVFIVVQLLPGGRAMVPLGWLGQDGWFFVIASTTVPGALWAMLGTMAGPPMRLVMPGYVTPLFLCVLLLVGRNIQMRRLMAE